MINMKTCESKLHVLVVAIACEPSFVDGLRSKDIECGPVADNGLSLSFGVVGSLVGSVSTRLDVVSNEE